MLEKLAEFEASDPYFRRTPLHCAAEAGHDKIVAHLLAHKPKLVNARDWGECTALHYGQGRAC